MEQNHRRTIRFKLNGRTAITEIATHETLLEVLRRDFSLFGGRESCGQGLCGRCTAIVDGIAVRGGHYFAAFAGGAEVPTVRGLASGGEFHSVSEAVTTNRGFQ